MGQSVASMTLQPDGLVYNPNDFFKPEFNKVGVAISGGIDSTALLLLAVHVYGSQNVIAFSASLPGGRRAWEPIKAATVASVLGVRHEIIQGEETWFVAVSSGGTSGTSATLAAAKVMYPELDATFVGNSKLWFAPTFTPTSEQIQQGQATNTFAPLLALQKHHSIDIIRQLNSDILSLTHSCGTQYLSHCGRCYCCRERVRGFAALGANDSATYDRPWNEMKAEVYPTSIYENRNWS